MCFCMFLFCILYICTCIAFLCFINIILICFCWDDVCLSCLNKCKKSLTQVAGVTSPCLGGEDSQPFFVWELDGGGSLVLIRKNTHTWVGQTEPQKMQIWKLSIGVFLAWKNFTHGVFTTTFWSHIFEGSWEQKKMDIMIYVYLPLFLEIWVCTFGFLHLWHVDSPFWWTHHRRMIIPGSTCCTPERPFTNMRYLAVAPKSKRNAMAIPSKVFLFFLVHQHFTIKNRVKNRLQHVTKVFQHKTNRREPTWSKWQIGWSWFLSRIQAEIYNPTQQLKHFPFKIPPRTDRMIRS